jgi:transcriptional regulator with XRE-family HTH domain
MDASLFGPRLRELRKAAGLSQKELAEKIEASPNTVSQWETGVRGPDLETLVELAEFFGVATDAFFEPAKPKRRRRE